MVSSGLRLREIPISTRRFNIFAFGSLITFLALCLILSFMGVYVKAPEFDSGWEMSPARFMKVRDGAPCFHKRR